MKANALSDPAPSKPDDYDTAMRSEIENINVNGMTPAEAKLVTSYLYPDVQAWYAAKAAWLYSVAAPIVNVFANYPTLFH
jgi:hypothetical protein